MHPLDRNSTRGFASDNNSGIHPEILAALIKANEGHAVGYGEDPITKRAEQKFKDHFGSNAAVYIVFNGTGANVLGLSQLTRSFQAVLCSDTAHLGLDECGAPEKFAGIKVILIPTSDGKLTPQAIAPSLIGSGVQHHSQPKVISITQTTELGTVYTAEEIKALSTFAKSHNLYLHMDGARISNAAVSLGLEFRDFTVGCGVDVLSFGGTKNGMMGGEAVIIFNPALAQDFKFVRKQGMQLASKMRFISAQFEALLSNRLWWRLANHANEMAALLAHEVSQIPGVELCRPPEANGVFARIPTQITQELQKQFYFYVWNEAHNQVRWMTSFDTTSDDIARFTSTLRALIKSA